MNDQEQDIFGEVAETEVPKAQNDPNHQLYIIPEGVAEWFIAKNHFGKNPKEVKDCTASLVVRFLSWQISAEQQVVYQGSGTAVPGTLRNQLIVRYHPIPEGYADGALSGRAPCKLQFGESCKACEERIKAEFAGVKVWLDLSNYSYPADVCSIPSAGEIGWTKSCKEGLYHGQNSGYGALNLAMVLGADPIYLLGYDCAKGPDGEKNYHGGYPTASNPAALEKFKEAFKAGAKMLRPGRHHIYNLNPDSALRCFPMMDIAAICGIGKGRQAESGFMVVSYYTKGTGYEQEIKNLEASLKIHRLPYKIFEYEPVGTWRANLNFKSECILRAMDMFPDKDIVFLDSDAVVRRYPVLFDELSRKREYDLSAHFFRYRPESGDADELLAGTLWIQNGGIGRQLVEKWHEVALARTADTRHQLCLKMAIAEMEKAGEKVRVNRHPFAYTCVFDYPQAYKIEPVIEHFQASRRLRREVGYGVNLIHSRVAGKA